MRFLCLPWIALWAGMVQAGDTAQSEPLGLTNTSPFVGDRLIPGARSARVRPGLSVDAGYRISSHFVDETAGSERLFLDGETNDLTLDLRFGFSEVWHVSLGITHRQQRDGFLDGVINDWHDVFGLPDGGRSQFENHVLNYTYKSDVLETEFRQPTSGLADVTLATQYVFSGPESLKLAVAAGVELDSGEPSDLTGSGGAEGFAALRFSGEHLRQLPIVWHGQLGVSRASEVVPLDAIARETLWFAGLSMDWQFSHEWSAIFQVDGHASPFRSDIAALGDKSIMLGVGVRWRYAPRWSVEIGFTEDIAVETAPDVTFFSRLSYRP